jgi:DNA polymerase III subunit beta
LKFSAVRSNLLSELQIVARATAVRGAIQTLTGILFSLHDDKLELAATDTEIGLRSSIEVEVERAGSVLVPGRLLVEILRALSGDSVTLEHKPDRNEVEITAGQARFAVRSLSAEDFPRLPQMSEGGTVTVPGKPFARTIERVARAASRDETRPVLTGILVSVEERALKMVATDSYRLSVKETQLDDEAERGFEANVPARALRELSRIIGDVDASEVVATAQDNQIVFGVDRVTLSSRMIDGQFPNYRQLLPETYEHEVSVEKDEFLAVVRRVSLMAQRNAPLRLRFEDGAVTMSAQTPDVGEAAETLPVNYSGEALEIGFNPQFLQDGLESVESTDLVLKLISSLRPGLIEAGDSDEGEDGKFLYLIMPVRLNV